MAGLCFVMLWLCSVSVVGWDGGYTGFTSSVCLSARLSRCRQNRVRSVSSTILTNPLHIYTSYQPTPEVVLRVELFQNSNFLPNIFTSLFSTSSSDLLWMSDHISGMDSDSDPDKFYSTEKDTGTISGLHNFHEYTVNHKSLTHIWL